MKINTKNAVMYAVIFALSLIAGVILTEFPDKRIATQIIVQEDDIVQIPSGEEMSGDKININTASAQTLMMLDGIAQKLSGRIIDYREQNGRFEAVENLMDVPGISAKLYESIKDKICVR